MTSFLVATWFAGVTLGMAADWPGFRGGPLQGVSPETGVPTVWSPTQNVVWKTPIPGAGWSSPVISRGRVFLTTAEENGESRRVLAVDAASGKTIWNTEVVRIAPGKKEGLNSYSTSTVVTDGERVYAVFGDGTLAALSREGKVLWLNRDHKYHGVHGMGVSPVLWRDLVVVPYDITSEGPDVKVGHTIPWDRSFVVALDTRTGKLRWKADRGMSRVGHVTPVVIEHGGKTQLVSGAGDWIIGYDIATGQKVWWAKNPGEGVVPSIVSGGGMIYATSGFGEPAIRAVRLGGQGDVTQTHIAWSLTKGVPMVATMLYVNDTLYSVSEGGIAQAIRPTTGEVLWTGRIGGKHLASPVSAGGKVYFLSQEGETIVIDPADEYRIVARNPMEETCQSSLAIANGRIYLRTKDNLYSIGR